MRFDWYQATVPAHPLDVVEAVRSSLADDGEVVEGRGKHGYAQSFTIKGGDGDRVALVLCGGSNGYPNVQATGSAAHAFADLVRDLWPDHKVTRFDAAEDVVGEGVYERFEGLCKATARDHGVKGLSYVPDDLADGRTYYIGAASSDVRVRLYEKTAEQRRKLPPDRHHEVPENWVRVEAQVRPPKGAGYTAASLTPAQVWGCSGWTGDLARQLFAMDVERIAMQGARESDHDRSYRYMLQQYGPTLRRMLADLGSWECVGLTIGDDLDRIARLKPKR
jgi:hypothetical protein